MMYADGYGAAPIRQVQPINPRLLLLHQILGGGQMHPGPIKFPGHPGPVPVPYTGGGVVGEPGGVPGPSGPTATHPGYPIHGFGPGGAVTFPGAPPVKTPNPNVPWEHLGEQMPGTPDLSGQIQQLASAVGGGQPQGGLLQLASQINPFGSGPIDKGYNPAGYERAVGNDQQAARDWWAHHPGAVGRGQIPPWVEQQMAHQVHPLMQHFNGVEHAHNRARELAHMIARQRRGRGLGRSLRRVARGVSPVPTPTPQPFAAE